MIKRFCFIILCTVLMAFPAWADESEPSRVITCGNGQSHSDNSETLPLKSDTTNSDITKSETAKPDSGDTQQDFSKGASLGMFTTTGYCGCANCSGGHALTCSGTVPKANHTISANLVSFPLGTRLMIEDIIYTVEDSGSGVKENWIDIFYEDHDAAVAHGMKTQEVFAVEELRN